MAFDEEKQIQQLIELYRQGFEEILRIIIQKEAKGQWTTYWKAILKDVYDILSQLDDNTQQWIQQTIGQVYSQNAAQVVAYLNSLGLNKINEANVIHQRAIDVVAQNMADNLRDAFQFIGRRINDEFRRIGLEETGRKFVSGTTVRDMKQRLVQRLLDQGQTAFIDKLGRKWRLDSYAEMVARTTTREAATIATINECKEFGVDLVRISTHYPTCELCAPLQGKVFSLSGRDKRYPKYDGDRARVPVHPNCRHVLMPYIRKLDPNADETQRYSNTSLTKDPRSEAEKQAYKEMRDLVTIATNRKRAREILLNENIPLEEKIKAAQKLKKSYDNTGKRPMGIDAGILKQYEEYIKRTVTKDKSSDIINNCPNIKHLITNRQGK
ncbi:phage minor capsid protein [Thermoanaerobacterium sp. DL9XJH110]|uniref:phage minor capsid protein n=1 Tax=Thermoanaerobacterium sp. DL9XJH110 TaxID=3386643 RepID=UPI003BB79454